MRCRCATAALALAAVIGWVPLGCRRAAPPAVGGLYSVVDDEARYRIAKVVALDADGVHVRLYKNRWPQRPGKVAPTDLSLGRVQDADGFGIGHMVLSPNEFASWRPVYISREDLAPDELEGYRAWQRGRTGVLVGK
jgi:hypothetical protein